MNWIKGNRRQHRHRQGQSERQVEQVNNHQQRSLMPLAKARVGDRLWIAGYESKDGLEFRLTSPSYHTKLFSMML